MAALLYGGIQLNQANLQPILVAITGLGQQLTAVQQQQAAVQQQQAAMQQQLTAVQQQLTAVVSGQAQLAAQGSNVPARVCNSTARMDEPLAPLVVEDAGSPHALGTAPAAVPGVPFPADQVALVALTTQQLNQLQAFYGTAFQGPRLGDRRKAFAAYIGARLRP